MKTVEQIVKKRARVMDALDIVTCDFVNHFEDILKAMNDLKDISEEDADILLARQQFFEAYRALRTLRSKL